MKKITYIEHSGFMVELDTCYLLFDYYKGDIPELHDKKVYVFASHAHADHYSTMIFELLDRNLDVHLILSSDIKVNKHENVISMDPNESIELDDLQITTLESTDIGVAYLIKVEGIYIYHAGDLNWWHWEEENCTEENQDEKEAYLKQIDKLKDIPIDLAFVVLDPRQEDQFHYGMRAFLERCLVQYVFPMHFWGDYTVVKRFHQVVQNPEFEEKLIELHHSQEEINL